MRSENIYKTFGISDRIYEILQQSENELAKQFKEADQIAEINQLKVVKAMQNHHTSEACMGETTGYGYNDTGRDTLEKVYADVFGTEDALVRSQIVCGTHALSTALFGNTRPGDEILSPCGLPYDTLQTVIGLSGARGSLKEYGVSFRYTELKEDESFDFDAIKNAINDKTRLIEIQRSRGYDLRHTFSVKEISELISFIKGIKKDVIVLVDNCYGEFTELHEPSEYGADMVVGSLIKNPGGGIAPVGGYIAGTKECVSNAAARLTAPGLEKELGPSLGNNRLLFQGLFLSPYVVASAKKGAMLLACVCEKLGFDCYPSSFEERHDIIQAVRLGTPEKVISFCKGIQSAAPVDSFAAPEPYQMPGYENDIIMAAGCFISGSSIELSSDGPLREPYAVFFQGGLTYAHSKLGIALALNQLEKDGLLIP